MTDTYFNTSIVPEQSAVQAVAASTEISSIGILERLGNEALLKQNTSNQWRNSTLFSINELKADYSGKVGELYMEELCRKCGIPVETTGDVNSKDGTYDQKILDKKVEIKTARLGGDKFQHESLSSSGSEFWAFIDITPEECYLTLLPNFDLNQRHPILLTKPTLRKNTTNVFKWDFSVKHINTLIQHGAAIKIDRATSLEIIGQFIRRVLQ